MRQSINKRKIYFYLLIFFFLSTSSNLNYISKFSKLNLIKSIEIKGLNEKEKIYLKNELEIYKNRNIFLVKKNEILKSLSIFNFLENFSIQKILPSELIIFAKKTNFLGIAILDGEKFYIGSNGKLILISQVTKEENLPYVFGKFSVIEFLDLQKDLLESKIDLKSIKKYFYHKGKRWDLEFANGVVVMLPYKNLKEALKYYNYLINSNNIQFVKSVDLRILNRIIITNEQK